MYKTNDGLRTCKDCKNPIPSLLNVNALKAASLCLCINCYLTKKLGLIKMDKIGEKYVNA